METLWHSTLPVIPCTWSRCGPFATAENGLLFLQDSSRYQPSRGRQVCGPGHSFPFRQYSHSHLFVLATDTVPQYGKYKGKQRESFVNISSPHLLHVGTKPQKSVDRDSLSPSRSPRSPLRSLEPSPPPRSAPRAHTDAITSVFTFC